MHTRTPALLFPGILLALSTLGLPLLTGCDAPPIDNLPILEPVVDSAMVPQGYHLVWNDEFNGSGLPDAAKWNYDTALNYFGWGNNEQQFYTEGKVANASQYDGKLHLVARVEAISEIKYGTTYNYQYTSARLRTHPSTWTYGFFEVRAKMPGGTGTWPAIWAVGVGNWPGCGEIDVMEQWGNDTAIGGNFHVQLWQGVIELIKHYWPTDPFNTFHNYQLLWTQTIPASGSTAAVPARLTVMADGNVVNTYEKDLDLGGQASHDQWPFDDPQYFILNLAISPGTVDESIFPRDFQIDYIRIYQKN